MVAHLPAGGDRQLSVTSSAVHPAVPAPNSPPGHAARGVMDPMVIVDGRHYLHRFHADDDD